MSEHGLTSRDLVHAIWRLLGEVSAQPVKVSGPGCGCTGVFAPDGPPDRTQGGDDGLRGRMAGDLVLFSNEAWHGRSENTSDKWTRRLFYNLSSRSSRTVTVWAGVVDQQEMEAARAALPAEYRHMIKIDADLTKQLGAVEGSPLRRWSLRSNSSDAILRDMVYQWKIYGQKAENDNRPGFLLPYTTRLVETASFNTLEYLSHFKPKPTLKNIARYVRSKAYAAVGAAE